MPHGNTSRWPGCEQCQWPSAAAPAEQSLLTQGDILKIVELIVGQLPVPSNTTSATSQMPLALTSSQVLLTTLPGTVTLSSPVRSFSLSIAGITETSYIKPSEVENALEGNGNIAGRPVHFPLYVTDSY